MKLGDGTPLLFPAFDSAGSLTSDGAGGLSWAGASNPFNQDLNTTDSPTFAHITMGASGKINSGAGGGILYGNWYVGDSIITQFGFVNQERCQYNASNIPIQWSTLNAYSGVPDVSLYRDEAHVLAIKGAKNRETESKSLRVYNTTDATDTNYERGVFGWQATPGTLTIGTEAGGTGTVQPMELVAGTSLKVQLTGASATFDVYNSNVRLISNRPYLQGTGGSVAIVGALQPQANNSFDIGGAAILWRHGYFGGTVTANAFIGDGSGLTGLPGGGDAFVANPLSQFAATTSAQLAGVISDETGSGALVFATSPTLVTPILGTPASGDLSNCTGYPAGNPFDQSLNVADSPTFEAITLETTTDVSVSGHTWIDCKDDEDKSMLKVWATSAGSGGTDHVRLSGYSSNTTVWIHSGLLVATNGSNNGKLQLGVGKVNLQGYVAGVLEQTNKAVAQKFEIYNDDSGANYERFSLDFQATAGVMTIGPEAGGTGVLPTVTAIGDWTFPESINVFSTSQNTEYGRLGVSTGQGGAYSWSSSNLGGTSIDTYLYREDTRVVSVRQWTNPNSFRVYNTRTSSSVGEWFAIDAQTTANVFTVGPVANGGATVRPVTAIGDWNFTGTVTGTNPFDQDLNEADDVKFDTLGVGRTVTNAASRLEIAVPGPGSGDSAFFGGISTATNSYRQITFAHYTTGDGASDTRCSIAFRLWPGSGGSDSEIEFNTNKYGTSTWTNLVCTRDGGVTISNDLLVGGDIEVRDDANAKHFAVYSTYDGANDLYFAIDYQTTANVCTIGPVSSGTEAGNDDVTAIGDWTFAEDLVLQNPLRVFSGTTALPGISHYTYTNSGIYIGHQLIRMTVDGTWGFELNDSGNAWFLGDVTANAFIGDGSGLTSLPNPFDQDLNTTNDVEFDDIICGALGIRDSVYTFTVAKYAMLMRTDYSFSWTSGTNYVGSPVLTLLKDATGTLAQRVGTNPQRSNIYESWTNASNNQGFKIDAGLTTAGVVEIGAFANGTGTLPTVTATGDWTFDKAIRMTAYDNMIWGPTTLGTGEKASLYFGGTVYDSMVAQNGQPIIMSSYHGIIFKNLTGTTLGRMGVSSTSTNSYFVGNVGVGNVTSPTAVLHLKAGTTAANTSPLKFTTQASPLTAIEPGTMEYVGHSLQFSQFLKRRGVSMTEDVRTTTTTVENTVTESAALATVQHGADYLEVGKAEETVLIGTIEQRSNPSAICTFDVKYAGSTIHSEATLGSTAIAAGTPFRLTINATCRSIGATGTMQINSLLEIAGEVSMGGSSIPTVDTTSAQDTTVTAQWGEANASDILTVQQGWTHCIETDR